MSEKIPQSNHENEKPKNYLTPRGDGGFDIGYVTGNEAYVELRQRDGSKETIKRVEVQLITPEGVLISPTVMVAEYILSEAEQQSMRNILIDIHKQEHRDE
ncbi:MAG TPA: hypothetical protein VGO98_02620 [Candidatus Saccharimonadales bacterium]|jgi:hypothetical protein|nr:hypothetical protein [Candidatus Saccharimonadales bacterium]